MNYHNYLQKWFFFPAMFGVRKSSCAEWRTITTDTLCARSWSPTVNPQIATSRSSAGRPTLYPESSPHQVRLVSSSYIVLIIIKSLPLVKAVIFGRTFSHFRIFKTPTWLCYFNLVQFILASVWLPNRFMQMFLLSKFNQKHWYTCLFTCRVHERSTEVWCSYRKIWGIWCVKNKPLAIHSSQSVSWQ